MNTHEEWTLISAYIDGELASGERGRLETHLAGCASCRWELESLRRTKALAASAPRRALPPDLLAGIQGRFERPPWTRVLSRQWSRPAFRITTEAAAAAVLALSLWFGMNSRTSEELPLGPLLAAHDRYSGEALLSQDTLVASNFSSELAFDKGED